MSSGADTSEWDDIPQMIADCEARIESLSEWEQGFINSVAVQLGNGLSQKQAEILERIWERVTKNG